VSGLPTRDLGAHVTRVHSSPALRGLFCRQLWSSDTRRSQQTSTYLNATLRGLHESMRESRSIPPRLQTACKHTRPPLPACSQAGSRQKREVPSSLTVVVGGVDGTRARSPSPQDAAARLSTSTPQTAEQREGVGGVDGTRTRGLRRDRPAF
jgi:hypothetical protein